MSTEEKNSNSGEEVKSDPIDDAIKNLIESMIKIQDKYVEVKKGTPHWSVCLSKFQTSYLKAKNPEGFVEMFQQFHNSFRKQYCIEIFVKDKNDELEVNDDFFRDDTEFTIAYKAKKTTESKRRKSGQTR